MLIVGTVGELIVNLVSAFLSPELNETLAVEVVGLFGDGCKDMPCSLALRLLPADDSRLACRLLFAVYSCNDSMVTKKLNVSVSQHAQHF